MVSQKNESNTIVYDYIEKSNTINGKNSLKSFEYLKRALMIKDIDDSTRIHLYSNVAAFYRKGGAYYMSLNYYIKELEITEKYRPEESFLTQNNIAGCYYELKNYEKAREFWEKALKGYEKSLKSDIQEVQKLEGSIIYNNLGVLEKTEGNYSEALLKLEKFKQQNEIFKDTLNIIMAYENLSELFLEKQETDKAFKYLRSGIRLAKQMNSEYDLASLYTNVGKLFSEKSILDSATFYFEKAYALSQRRQFFEFELKNAENLARINKKKGNYKVALDYFEVVNILTKRISEDENERKLNMLESEQEEKKIQYELFVEQQRREYFLIGGIIILFLFSSVILLLLKLQKSKARRRSIEKELLSKELEERKKEIKNSTLQIIQNTEIIKNTQRDLEELQKRSDSKLNSSFNKIITDLKSGTQAFNKKEFEKLFIEVDNEFYKKLIEKHSNLTKNELRLCAFLKLNLSTKEISSITQQSVQSITVARSRMRKKMGLAEGENLVTYLLKI